MNLGRRRVTNDELTRCFEDMGFTEVSPFLASGNVVFDAGRKQPATVQRKIEAGLESALGYAVPTFLRSAAQVRAIAAHQPFAPSTTGGKLQVMLLAASPTPAKRRAVMKLHRDDDQLALGETELYWLPRGRMSDSALDLAYIEKTIGPTTTRTHRTITRLYAKFLSA